jgi:Cu-Zn family superoxide dismutase
MNSFQTSFVALIFLLVAGFSAHSQTPAEKPSAPLKAVAVLHPSAGSKVSGTVTFTEEADGVQVHAEITGLTPGNHGFHVHEFGDCSAADASSAGKATLKYVDHQISLTNDERSVIGRSVVVHEKADDLKSQPSGDSGARIACGVIGRAKSQ